MSFLDLIQCLALLALAYGMALLTVVYLDASERMGRMQDELDQYRRRNRGGDR